MIAARTRPGPSSLERLRAARRRSRVPLADALGCVAAEPAGGHRAGAAVRQHRDGRVRRAGGRHRGAGAERAGPVAGGRHRPRRHGAADSRVGPGRGGAHHDRRADARRRRRRGDGRGQPRSAGRRRTPTRSSCASRSAPAATTCARPATTCARATPVFPAGDRAHAPATSGCWPRSGATEVAVVPRARVGVLSTGDELVDGPASRSQPGQIRDSNRPHPAGPGRARPAAIGVDLGRVADDEAAITDGHRAGRGDAATRSSRAAACQHGRLRLREGRARPHRRHALDAGGHQAGQAAGVRHRRPAPTVARVPVFGLPGNPVSSMVSFELFARPGLRPMMGRAAADLDRPRVRAVVDEPLRRRPDGKIHFARVVCRYGERRPLPRAARPAARARTTSAPWSAPTPWPCCPTATRSSRAAELDVLLTDLGA